MITRTVRRFEGGFSGVTWNAPEWGWAPMSSNVTLSAIGQIAIPVKDLDRATAFYRDALGIPFLFTAPPGLAFFDAGGVRLMLSRPESVEASASSVLYFKVGEIRAAYDDLKSRQVRFVDEPHIIAEMATYDLWMAFFKDSEDNTHAIMSEAPRK